MRGWGGWGLGERKVGAVNGIGIIPKQLEQVIAGLVELKTGGVDGGFAEGELGLRFEGIGGGHDPFIDPLAIILEQAGGEIAVPLGDGE